MPQQPSATLSCLILTYVMSPHCLNSAFSAKSTTPFTLTLNYAKHHII
ncbi:hypothetical protein TSMEX_008295 [Taenia solium]|eukprot:TsM_000415900 transcript=TsM_000415900 gene=TsM_000415900